MCYFHGGAAKHVMQAAADRIQVSAAKGRAKNFLKEAGFNRIDDPVEALSLLAGEVLAAKDFFAGQIEELRYRAQTGEQIRAEVTLYERALDRCVKILEVMARLGIAERRTKVQEAEVLILATCLERVLERLELSDEQQALALTVVPEELKAITAPPAEMIAEAEIVGVVDFI